VVEPVDETMAPTTTAAATTPTAIVPTATPPTVAAPAAAPAPAAAGAAAAGAAAAAAGAACAWAKERLGIIKATTRNTTMIKLFLDDLINTASFYMLKLRIIANSTLHQHRGTFYTNYTD
jgi:hypothetical protein